jgi:hypothetical protein
MPKKLTIETSIRIAFLSRKQNDTGCWFLDAGCLLIGFFIQHPVSSIASLCQQHMFLIDSSV